jgi:hypothetical protein
MNKASVICKMHELTDNCLLGAGTWPLDGERLAAFFKMVRDLGLEEDIPGSPGTTRSTALGIELKLDLFTVFVGAWDVWEIPIILENHGYIGEFEAEKLWTDYIEPGRSIRWVVLRAYLKFCNRSRFLN